MPKYYIPKHEFRIITSEEIKPYIEKAEKEEVKAIIALAWLTGARISDLLKLKRENFLVDEERKMLTVVIQASKGGSVGFPTFSFEDPFVPIILQYLQKFDRGQKLFRKTKRWYQQELFKLNMQIKGNNQNEWITFHYLRHSRITYIARVLKATPEEIKSFTGHRSSAYEEYVAPRRVERFAGKFQ